MSSGIHLNKQTIEEINFLKEQGIPVIEIADAFNISNDTVYRLTGKSKENKKCVNHDTESNIIAGALHVITTAGKAPEA